jgi:phosphoglycerate transport regulatory protein PgtC
MSGTRIALRSFSIVVAVGASMAAHGGPITVITSFPKEITSAYKAAFEKTHPDIKLEILNKNTNASIAYIREIAPGLRPEVFWASAPDAFEVMAREKLLEKLPADVGNPNVPEKIGNYPLNDPDGYYRGQALAGYGIMWNTRYVQANNLPKPTEWSDLTKPAYFGHVAISSPSRSGTTHLTVETILQGEGWEKGWSQLLQIAGNCAAVTERSFGVPDGVNNGQFGFGLVIDYLGLAGKYSGFPVEFVYPTTTAVVPASIAIVAGGKNNSDAKKFLQFTLSAEGQELLLDPKISRLPVLPNTYLSNKIPKDYPNIFLVARKSKVQFNANLSESRYAVVSSLFDQIITFRLKELQAAAKVIHEAEKKLSGQPNAQAAALVKQARDLAFTPVLDETTSKSKEFLEPFHKSKKDVSVGNKLTALEEQWNTKAKANYEKAAKLATDAASMVK